MCCFTGPITSVSHTRIFARGTVDGRQYLVYSMNLDTAADVAMVLPIPLHAGSGEHEVAFIDLTDHPAFFASISSAWPPPERGTAGAPKKADDAGGATLIVQNVGAFDASCVPTIGDFSRIDQRFRLPAGIWEKLPNYRSFGFVVFTLRAGNSAVQPMAFSFPRADARALFIPTVHIHDGTVHERAHFDHELYLQDPLIAASAQHDWDESRLIGRQVTNFGDYPDLIVPDLHFHWQRMHGDEENRDVIVPLG
jgi:hypothetical protein